MGEGQKGRARTSRARKRKQEKRRKKSVLLLIFAVGIFTLSISSQIIRLYQKKQEYKAQETLLQLDLQEQRERSEEISALEEYISSDDYIEQVAKSKLGLVYPNEIIFKEQKTEN